MANLTNKSMHPCWATFSCPYIKGKLCSFRVWEETFLKTLTMRDPRNRIYYQSMVGVLVEPCLELNEEERRQGIPEIFGLNSKK